MPNTKSVGVIGGTIIAAAIAGTVVVNRQRPSQPPATNPPVTQSLHPFRPNVCTPDDIATAQRWSAAPGYGWMATRCDLVVDWRMHAQQLEDPAVYLARQGYDSPAVDCDNTLTLDLSQNPSSVLVELQRMPFVLVTYHGRGYKFPFNPMLVRQTIPIVLPCYADGGKTDNGRPLQVSFGNQAVVTVPIEMPTGTEGKP